MRFPAEVLVTGDVRKKADTSGVDAGEASLIMNVLRTSIWKHRVDKREEGRKSPYLPLDKRILV